MSKEDYRHHTIDSLLRLRADTHGQRIFVRSANAEWTYQQVHQAADRLAAGLQRLGLKRGDRLAIILPNSPEFVISLFAAARSGLMLVPINIRRGAEEVLARLQRTRPKAAITFSDPQTFHGLDHLAMLRDLQPKVGSLATLITVADPGGDALSWQALLDHDQEVTPTEVTPDYPAAIIHTLGSTGQPRGAILLHGALVRNAAGVAQALEADQNDVFLGAVPFSNTFGLTATILACAVAGAQVVPLRRYTPQAALEAIERYGVTVHHGVPTMFAMELNHPQFRPERCATLRTGILSGAPCPPELVAQARQRMGFTPLLAYGLTEASPSVTITGLHDGPVTATETAGRPMEGVELRIVDQQGQPLPPGQEGEILVRGYNLMRGYWEDPQATAQALDDEGWLHTGDLGVLDADGNLRVVGRKDEIINRGGFKIHPGTVEMVLRAHPAVKAAAVVGVPDPIYGEIAYACVVPAEGAQVSEQELLAYAAERLADFAVPERVVFFETLPRLGSGRAMRNYLRERVRLRGRAWKFGKNIDTDAIIPARHCNTADPRELAKHCMEDADPDFIKKMRRGDIIVAETNFGCGSSREVAPLSIKSAGVSAVIAKSFARIFFRNAINIGLPILESAEAVDGISTGDEIEVEPATGTIRNLTTGQEFRATPYPEFLQRIIDRGGLLAYVEERLAGETS